MDKRRNAGIHAKPSRYSMSKVDGLCVGGVFVCGHLRGGGGGGEVKREDALQKRGPPRRAAAASTAAVDHRCRIREENATVTG